MAYNNPKYKQPIIRKDLVTEVMAIDCEMVVALKNDGPVNAKGNPACWKPAGRCSIVNSRGQVVLDCHIYHPKSIRIVNPLTRFSGLTWADLKPHNGALPFAQVRNTVIQLLQNRTIVGHDIRNDLEAMNLHDEVQAKRIKTADTQRLFGSMEIPYGGTRRSKLRDLAHECLGRVIQTAEHDSTEDARATMDLYHFYNTHHAAEEAANRQYNLEMRAEARAARLEAKYGHLDGTFKKWETTPDPRPDAEGFVTVYGKSKRKFISKHQNAHDHAKAALQPGDPEDGGGWVPDLPWEKKDKPSGEQNPQEEEKM